MSDDGAWGLSAAESWRAQERPEAYGLRGMVASAHPVAASIGLSVLQRGGNAFDAAIATAAAEGVLLPMKCGLGADAFVVLYDAKRGETVGFNGSGVAASGATSEYYTSRGLKNMPIEGVHSVGVPGGVSVYEAIHRRYGSLPWAELWAPAICLAEEGLVITAYIAKQIGHRAEALGRYPYSAAQWLPNGRAPAAGERWNAPNLARSLRIVAEGGAEAFYRGEIAEKIVAFLKKEGALFELDDFARQQADVYTPIATDYRGYQIYETAPPSQGFMLLEQLNILEGFDLGGLDPFGADRIHLLVEAKKLAFADRNRYAGDRAFVQWPLEELISKEYAAGRRAEIDPRRAGVPGGALVAEHSGDTSYFCVADGEGNAVSFIHSLSHGFGSAVVAGETGITLNNRAGRGFSLNPNDPNVIAPGKRTMHTLNAYLVCKDNRAWMVGGTPGGDQQTQWNAQILTSLIDHNLGLQESVEAPRWYSLPGTDPASIDQPMTVRLENRIAPAVSEELAARGHDVRTLGPWGGGGSIQLIQIDPRSGVLRGASDPRPGGAALGF